MNAFLNSLRLPLKNGSTLIKLLYVNVGLFVILKLGYVICLLLGINTSSWLTYIEMPSSWQMLWHQPWSLLTYMFLHMEFFHIFFNIYEHFSSQFSRGSHSDDLFWTFYRYHNLAIDCKRLAISIAESIASQPLFPDFVPALSIACSMESVVNIPNITGFPLLSPT